jgi:hypothetical protein
MSSWWGERESSSGEAAVEEVVAIRELTHASTDGGDQVVGVGQSAVDRGRVSQTRTIGPPSCWCELDPLDIDARWALVKCYALRGLLDQAWQALTTGEQGQPLDPRSPDETALWVMLGARFSANPYFTGRALALTQRWRDDSDLVGKVLANLRWRAVQPAQSLSEQDGEQLRTTTAAYLERFRGSTVFRAVQIGPEDDPLKNIAEELRSSHENAEELHRRTAAGELPAGMLALSSGRSYAEILLRPSAERPHVYAADTVTDPAEAEVVQATRSGRVVVDTSAAVTLALLEPGVTERLMGHPRSLVTTDQLFTDALQAQESLALRSDMVLTWDEGDARPAQGVGFRRCSRRGRPAPRP